MGGRMTTLEHITDWKVTGAHRALVAAGWLLALVALVTAAAAIVLKRPELWAAVAGLAFFALAVGIALPEPVPHDMLSERRSVVRSTP
jgi:predicted cobalt transporter CbtA